MTYLGVVAIRWIKVSPYAYLGAAYSSSADYVPSDDVTVLLHVNRLRDTPHVARPVGIVLELNKQVVGLQRSIVQLYGTYIHISHHNIPAEPESAHRQQTTSGNYD